MIRPIFDLCVLVHDKAESAAAVHVATTVAGGVDGELSPMSSKPPDVQLRRTWFGEMRALAEARNEKEVE